VKVVVDEKVAEMPIDLTVDDAPVEKVLELAAKAADTKLFRMEDGSFVLGPFKPGQDREIREALAKANVAIALQQSSLTDVLGFLASMSGVSMVVDPQVLRTRNPGTLELTLNVQGISVENALSICSQMLGLKWDVRWGIVFVSTEERLAALPTYALPPTPTGERPVGERKLQMRLATEEVSFEFDEAPLPTVLDFVCKVRDLPVVLDEKAKTAAAELKVSAKVQGLTVDRTLAMLLYPRGFEFEVTKDAVVVKCMKR
jgi:type II secretory pathway component GspD/PulD (secretin)